MFRRRSSDAPEAPDLAETDADDSGLPTRAGQTPKKGAPTPKRSQAEANRRQQAYQAPSDRKAATKQARQRDAVDRQRRTQAMQRGESWAMPRKDQGPVRALARDVVDSRRGLGEYYMLMVIVLVVLLVLPGNTTKLIADIVVVALLAVIIFEGYLVGTKVKRLAAQRYPGENTRGIIMYTIMRGISMRRMRMPKPRVNRGDKI